MEPLQKEILTLLANTVWAQYTKENLAYANYLSKQSTYTGALLNLTCGVVFGLPEESVPDRLFLIFFPSPEGLEKKTIANSATTKRVFFFIVPVLRELTRTVRDVLATQCEYRGLKLDSQLVRDKEGREVDLDQPLAQVPYRMVLVEAST